MIRLQIGNLLSFQSQDDTVDDLVELAQVEEVGQARESNLRVIHWYSAEGVGETWNRVGKEINEGFQG